MEPEGIVRVWLVRTMEPEGIVRRNLTFRQYPQAALSGALHIRASATIVFETPVNRSI